MLITEQKVEIQCTKVTNMSNLSECLHLGTPTAHAQNRMDMPFKIILSKNTLHQKHC